MSKRQAKDPILAAADVYEQTRIQALEEASAFASKARRNPIATLGLRYSTELHRLVAETTMVSLGDLDLEFDWTGALVDCGGSPAPEYAKQGTCIVRPLGLYLTPVGPAICLVVLNRDPSSRIKLRWHRASDPSNSAIYLVDPVNGDYLYPIDSSLQGEVVCGVPKSGIVVFEPFRQATDRVQLHISDVPLGPGPGKRGTFLFEFRSVGLRECISSELADPSFDGPLHRLVDDELSGVWKEFLRSQRGCGFILAGVLAASGASAFAAWMAYG